MASPQAELLGALSSLYISGQYSDLTLVCGTRQYPAHKALLCPRSSFFERACNGPFAEAQSGEIDLSEEDEVAVEHMVHYFYYLDYLISSCGDYTSIKATKISPEIPSTQQLDTLPIGDPLLATAAANDAQRLQGIAVPPIIPLQCSPPSSTTPSRSNSAKTLSRQGSNRKQNAHHTTKDDLEGSSALLEMEDSNKSEAAAGPVIHARVYALAEKYDVRGLKALAQEKFELSLSHTLDESTFVKAAEEAYTSTIDSDRGLRDVVLQKFRQRPELATKPDVQRMAQSVSCLAFDLYRMSNGIPL